MSDKKLVIIPTYNEIENIEDIISCVFSLEEDFDILIVDDSSPDGTGEKVADLIPTYSNRLFLEVRSTKNGLGRAYIHGFKWALQKGYDYIFEMDADFSHNPNDLIKLYRACKNGADLAVGSRYCQGVNVVNWPMNRVLLSFFASKYVRLITGLPINDSTAGFVCFTRKVLEELPLDQVELVGYGFQIEMKFRAYCKKFKIVEIPIIFTDRTKGKSKMSGAIISEAVFGVIKMKFMSLLGRL
ncbi:MULTISPECIES: polyprenol monophosphomannose synthase [Apibacter]|uniref:polyprenol monophosphomannose synthase n=1 Tax=Apibacter TaxID=1778601 RepID=UPI00140DA862|nr:MULTISPECIES: polyprenol monophosphomannose synthase [Apibacter]QII72444.1 polyprenol monophosphomannose synthase [Apibacter sp. B2966]QYN51702.1 polyprenol monophosphomannose synthase [Apibacter sp. ESL0404]